MEHSQSLKMMMKQEDTIFTQALHPLTVFDEKMKMHSSAPALTYFFETGDDQHPWRKASYTYGQLNQLSLQLASYLRNELSLKPGDTVGVYFSAGPEYAIWLLALWRAGLVYLPFAVRDNESNENIRQHISANLNVANGHYLITNLSADFPSQWVEEQGIGLIDHEQVITQQYSIENIPAINQDLSATAYAVCSSGSTGRPKMIAVPYEGIVDRIQCHIERMGMQQHEAVLAILSFEFDASLVEILMALLNGSNLVIAPPKVRQQQNLVGKFFQYCQRNRVCGLVTAIFLPSYLRSFVSDVHYFKGLKRLITTGESCDINILRKWHQAGINLYNGFGPSEVSFGSSLTELFQGEPASIHDAMNGVRMLYYKTKKVLKNNSQEDEYEIFIIGNGLGHYVGNDKLEKKHFLTTKDKIFNDDFRNEHGLNGDERIYRTFDIAVKKDNLIIFRCRMDRVLKRNGHQIFLDEVEKVINNNLKGMAKQTIASAIGNKPGNFAVFIQSESEEQRALIKNEVGLMATLDIPELKNKMPNEWYLLNSNACTYTSRRKTLKKYEDLIAQAELIDCFWTERNQLSKTEQEVATIWLEVLGLNKENQRYPTSYCQFQILGSDSMNTMVMLKRIWDACVGLGDNSPSLPDSLYRYLERNRVVGKLAKFIDDYRELNPIILPCEKLHNPQIFIVTNNKDLVEKLNCDFPVYAFYLSENTLLSENPDIYTQIISSKILTFCDKTNYQLIIDTNVLNTEILKTVHSDKVTILENDILDIDIIKNNILVKNEVLLQCQLERKLQQWKNHHLQNLPVIKSLYSTQHAALKEIKDFIIDETKKIAWLLGEVGSGKSSLCHQLMQESSSRQCIYLSLKNYNKIGDIDNLLKSQGFSEHLLSRVKEQPILLVLEDYDLMDRADCPNLWLADNFNTWRDIKLLITCRSWYMADLNSWYWWGETVIEKIVLSYPSEKKAMGSNEHVDFIKNRLGFASPAHMALLHYLFPYLDAAEIPNDLEFKRRFLPAWLENEQKRSRKTIAYNEIHYALQQISVQKIVSLKFQPLHWEKGLPSLDLRITRHESEFHMLAGLMEMKYAENNMRLHTVLSDWLVKESKLYLVEKDYWNADPIKIKQNYPSLEIIQKDCGGLKPIFSFAPITGDFPKLYRCMKNTCDPEQAFYCFVLTDADRKEKQNFSDRIKHYVDVITSLYSDPHDPRQELILVGYSFGFIQAYRVAKQLVEKGYKIATLFNLDCPSPIDTIKLNQNQNILPSLFNHLISLYREHNYFSDSTENKLKRILGELASNDERNIHIYYKELSNTFKKCHKTENSQSNLDRNFQNILENCKINFPIYLSSQQDSIENKENFSIISFHTKEKIQGLNEQAKYDWDPYCKNHTFVPMDGNHFNFFSESLSFLGEWSSFIKQIQIPAFAGPLNRRIVDYLRKQVSQFTPLKGYQEADAKDSNESVEKSAIELINQFITDKHSCIQVISGEPGSGKTTTLYHGFIQALDDYQSLQASFHWLPIYISLTNQRALSLSTVLATRSLNLAELNNLEKIGLLLFLDGFDEMIKYQSIVDLIKEAPVSIKVIVSCREYFYSQSKNVDFFGKNHKVMLIQEWTEAKVWAYFDVYGIRPEDNMILRDPLVLSWLKSPLIVNMIRLVLSDIQEMNDFEKTIGYNYVAKRFFVIGLFICELIQHDSLNLLWDGYLWPPLTLNNMSLAYRNYLLQLSIDTFLLSADNELPPMFQIYQMPDQGTRMMRKQSLVTWYKGKPEFLHFTFFEYFIIQALIQFLENPFCECFSRESGPIRILNTIPLHNKNSLLEDFKFQLTIRNRKACIQTLLDIIAESCYCDVQDNNLCQKQNRRAIAAGNAFTLLNSVGFSFSNMNFSKTIIKSANFSQSMLSLTNFNDAMLIDCDFSKAMLDGTQFNNATLINCEFGELPLLQLKKNYNSVLKKEFGDYWRRENDLDWYPEVKFFRYLEKHNIALIVNQYDIQPQDKDNISISDVFIKQSVSLWNNINNACLIELPLKIDMSLIPYQINIENNDYPNINYQNYHVSFYYDEINEELSISSFFARNEDFTSPEVSSKKTPIITYKVVNNTLTKIAEYERSINEEFIITQNNLVVFFKQNENTTKIISRDKQNQLKGTFSFSGMIRKWRYNVVNDKLLLITTDHQCPLFSLNITKNKLSEIYCNEEYRNIISNSKILDIHNSNKKIALSARNSHTVLIAHIREINRIKQITHHDLMQTGSTYGRHQGYGDLIEFNSTFDSYKEETIVRFGELEKSLHTFTKKLDGMIKCSFWGPTIGSIFNYYEIYPLSLHKIPTYIINYSLESNGIAFIHRTFPQQNNIIIQFQKFLTNTSLDAHKVYKALYLYSDKSLGVHYMEASDSTNQLPNNINIISDEPLMLSGKKNGNILMGTFYIREERFDSLHHFLRLKTWQANTTNHFITEERDHFIIELSGYGDGILKTNDFSYIPIFNNNLSLCFVQFQKNIVCLYNITASETVLLDNIKTKLTKYSFPDEKIYLEEDTYKRNHIIHIYRLKKKRQQEEYGIGVYFIKLARNGYSIKKLIQVFKDSFILNVHNESCILWKLDATKYINANEISEINNEYKNIEEFITSQNILLIKDYYDSFSLSFNFTFKEYIPTLLYCEHNYYHRSKAIGISQLNTDALTLNCLQSKNIAAKKAFISRVKFKNTITPPINCEYLPMRYKKHERKELLPIEIWYQIIGFLHYRDKLALSAVCRELRLLCNEEERLKSNSMLLTTSMINQAKIILLQYYGQARINACLSPLSEDINDIKITLAPSRILEAKEKQEPSNSENIIDAEGMNIQESWKFSKNQNLVHISLKIGFFAQKKEEIQTYLPVPTLISMLRRNTP